LDGEQILLDWNKEGQGHPYIAIRTAKVSPDHRFLVFTVDHTGEEVYHLVVKDLKTGFRYGGDPSVYSMEWLPDSKSFLYVAQNPETRRPDRVMHHVIGTNAAQDTLIYSESDPTFFINLYATKDEKFMVIASGSRTSTELHLIDVSELANGLKPKRVIPREPDTRTYLDHNKVSCWQGLKL
jgi:oligopeptidase B